MYGATEEQLRKGANNVLQYSLFHLVKELRGAGVMGPLSDLSYAVKSMLINALFGAIAELKSDLIDDWAEDWEGDSRVWALITVFGESNMAAIREEVDRLRENPPVGEFYLCGMYAARSLMQALLDGTTREYWLEHHEGMFASMGRLAKVIQ